MSRKLTTQYIDGDRTNNTQPLSAPHLQATQDTARVGRLEGGTVQWHYGWDEDLALAHTHTHPCSRPRPRTHLTSPSRSSITELHLTLSRLALAWDQAHAKYRS